ncbi:hypothetical protein [Pedobacter sp. ASV28]|uniref:hypothetical protein n=1 Tax=Pedobacter sp. ASV28 TaxID=2795123 RepID=UPI0018EA9DA5|nr:hypothetical protein [Pedobacter sp. ASV28]
MKIELRNIKFSEEATKETYAYTANLFIGGKRAGIAENKGNGGETIIKANNERGQKLIDQAERWCRSLLSEEAQMNRHPLSMELPYYADELITEYIIQTELDKSMQKGIVFGVPDGTSYYIQTYAVPFSGVLIHPKGPEIIANTISNKIFKDLKDGVKILNTNIPESILKMAGLSADQYVKPNVADIKTNYPLERQSENNYRNRTR